MTRRTVPHSELLIELENVKPIVDDQGGGVLKGTYVSHVGGPAGEPFPVVGSYTIPTSGPTSIAWTVAWAGWESTTSWCGLLLDDDDMHLDGNDPSGRRLVAVDERGHGQLHPTISREG